MKYVVIYEHTPNKQGRGAWSACVPDLPGCVSAGDTHAECETNIREAIELHERVNIETTAPAIPGRPPGSSVALTTSEVPKKAG
jgi:predicted RNase H-like HicB family nuclease